MTSNHNAIRPVWVDESIKECSAQECTSMAELNAQTMAERLAQEGTPANQAKQYLNDFAAPCAPANGKRKGATTSKSKRSAAHQR